jgi:hypothetical protein
MAFVQKIGDPAQSWLGPTIATGNSKAVKKPPGTLKVVNPVTAAASTPLLSSQPTDHDANVIGIELMSTASRQRPVPGSSAQPAPDGSFTGTTSELVPLSRHTRSTVTCALALPVTRLPPRQTNAA